MNFLCLGDMLKSFGIMIGSIAGSIVVIGIVITLITLILPRRKHYMNEDVPVKVKIKHYPDDIVTKINVRVNKVAVTNQIGKTKTNNQFVVINLSVTNLASFELSLHDMTIQYVVNGSSYTNDKFIKTRLGSRLTETGDLLFEVPSGEKLGSLVCYGGKKQIAIQLTDRPIKSKKK